MGLLGSLSAIGTALGPSLGGVLTSLYGWHFIFLINLPIGVLALLLAEGTVQERPKRAALPLDVVSVLLLAMLITAFALVMTFLKSLPLAVTCLLGAASLGTLVVFIQRQRVLKTPLVPLSLLSTPESSGGLVRSLLVAAVMMATLVVGPFYLRHGLLLSPLAVGVSLSVGPGLVALLGVPVGRLSDKLGSHRITEAGLTLMVSGSFLVALGASRLNLVAYLIPICVMTVGYALFQTSNNLQVMASAPAEQTGAVAGLLNLARNLGLITGLAVFGVVFSVAAGSEVTVATPPEIASGAQMAFALASVVSLLARLTGRRVTSVESAVRESVPRSSNSVAV